MKLSGHMTRAAFSSRKMKFEKKSADACLTVSHWINISSHVYTVDVDLDVFFMTAHHWVSVLLDVHLIPAVSPTSRGARARVIYTLPTQYSKCMCKTGRIFFFPFYETLSFIWKFCDKIKIHKLIALIPHCQSLFGAFFPTRWEWRDELS